ncbi:unnamed protein product [Rhizophagus irregularis]|nr:unnamed protein product [Rhizophagus irregularis]
MCSQLRQIDRPPYGGWQHSISSFLRTTTIYYTRRSSYLWTNLAGGYTSGTPTQRTAYMAPRPGYGIPLGGISLMAAPDSEVEKFIGGISDGDFNEHYIIKLDSYEPWSFKRRRKYLEIAFEFILVLKALNIFRLVVH